MAGDQASLLSAPPTSFEVHSKFARGRAEGGWTVNVLDLMTNMGVIANM